MNRSIRPAPTTYAPEADDDGRRALVVALVLAALAHGAFALGVQPEVRSTQVTRVTEIELVPLAPPPEPPPVEKPAPPPEAAREEAPRPSTASRAQAPAAARAGALLTAKPDPAKPAPPEEPVSFVTDPNGTSYGSGTVMRGGTAEFGEKGAVLGGEPSAKPAAAAPARPSGDGITPAANLSRIPRLTEADACRGYFPGEASTDVATVTLTVVVRPGGEVSTIAVLSENPRGEGFGRAARSCLLAKRFAPALDHDGKAVTAATTMNVRFSR